MEQWTRIGAGHGGEPKVVGSLQRWLDQVVAELAELQREQQRLIAEANDLCEQMVWA
jgi:hypothetical protein